MSNEDYLPGLEAVLAIDPGLTTGWAVISEGAIVGTGVFEIHELEAGIDTLVRGMHRAGYSLTAVIEEMPRAGRMSQLSARLEEARQILHKILNDTYLLVIYYVTPGAWKPSRIGRKTEVPETFGGKPVTIHQKDAIRMGCYFIEKGRLVTDEPTGRV